MKALRNHKSLIAAIAVLLVIAVGAGVYVAVSGNPSSDGNKTKSSDNKSKASDNQAHRPIIKSPSEVKPGTKVPSTPTSTSSTPPSGATGGSAPKPAGNR